MLLFTVVFSSFFDDSAEIGTDNNLNFAPKEIGLHFSVESQYSPKPWGTHHAWPAVHGQNWLDLLESCPELKLIVPSFYQRIYFAPCLPGR